MSFEKILWIPEERGTHMDPSSKSQQTRPHLLSSQTLRLPKACCGGNLHLIPCWENKHKHKIIEIKVLNTNQSKITKSILNTNKVTVSLFGQIGTEFSKPLQASRIWRWAGFTKSGTHSCSQSRPHRSVLTRPAACCLVEEVVIDLSFLNVPTLRIWQFTGSSNSQHTNVSPVLHPSKHS